MKYYVKVQNDVKIFVEDINHKAQNTILFVHGWPLNHNMYEYIVSYFAGKGYRCIAIDLRGYGQSDKPSHGYDYDTMATDLKKVIDVLNLNNITLVGHSMGGAICTRYMSKFNCFGVSNLCLLSAAAPKWVQSETWPYGYTPDEVDSLIESFKNDRPKSIINTSESFFYKFTSQGILNWFFDMCLKASAWSTVNSLYALKSENVFDDLSNIEVPTLILHGVHDTVCPFEFAKYMNEDIENSTLIPLEDGGHGAFYECKDDINNQLEKFIEKY